MDGQVVLAAAATLVALAFALSTLERWLARRRHHELAWTVSLFLFTGASAALWLGGAVGWNEATFKAFFLLGAIMNVPVLAVGTVYLLTNQRTGDLTFAGVTLVLVFCAGWVVAAPLVDVVPIDELPRGKEVFGPVPRIMAAVASGLGALVLFGGAAWSAARLLGSRRSRDAAGASRAPGDISPGRLAGANALIAAGTLVLSVGGLLNAAVGEMGAFALSLVIGISGIFAGFLVTNPTSSRHTDSLADWLQEAMTEPADYAQLTGPKTN